MFAPEPAADLVCSGGYGFCSARDLAVSPTFHRLFRGRRAPGTHSAALAGALPAPLANQSVLAPTDTSLDRISRSK